MGSAGAAHKQSGPPQGWPGKPTVRVVQAAANAAAENLIERHPA
jgi:hypothetical protein